MDDAEIELLKKLLTNKEVKETLKKILLEDEPKPVKKTVTKKTPVKKAVVKKTPVKKTTVKKPRAKKVEELEENFNTKANKPVDKNSREYGRSTFVDTLKEAVEEEINGKVINLVKDSKKLSKKIGKKQVREKPLPPKSNCGQCSQTFEGLGYLCDNCLRGRNAK